MANSQQAKKRIRQNNRRRAHRTQQQSTLRTYIKQFRCAVTAQKNTQASTAFKRVSKYLDSCSNKNIVHRNKANRLKRQFSRQLKSIKIAA